MKKDHEAFEKLKTEQLKQIEDMRNEETKKLRREKKLFEEHQKALRSMPDKKEREEIESLKTQVISAADNCQLLWHVRQSMMNFSKYRFMEI